MNNDVFLRYRISTLSRASTMNKQIQCNDFNLELFVRITFLESSFLLIKCKDKRIRDLKTYRESTIES